MRSAHIRHHRGAVCPFTPARATGSISLNRSSAASAADLTPIPGSSRGERWSATRRPGRWALKSGPRTGGRIPPSSRTGMFGAGSRVCFMPGGPGRARRRWCAARAPWTFVTRSVWWRSTGNQLGPGHVLAVYCCAGPPPPRRTPAFGSRAARYPVRCSAFRCAPQITSKPHDCLCR
jgi:hypothetical protein